MCLLAIVVVLLSQAKVAEPALLRFEARLGSHFVFTPSTGQPLTRFIGVDATFEVRPSGENTTSVRVTGCRLDPASNSSLIWAPGLRADSSAEFTISRGPAGAIVQLSRKEGAGPMAEFLEEAVVLLVPRRLIGPTPAEETRSRSSTDQIGYYQSQQQSTWRRDGDSVVAAITGSAVTGDNTGNVLGESRVSGNAVLWQDLTGVTRGRRTIEESGESRDGNGSSGRTGSRIDVVVTRGD